MCLGWIDAVGIPRFHCYLVAVAKLAQPPRHAPEGLSVGTEVLAAPVIRDKLVLNITDGIRAQYEGGPDKNAQFAYPNHSLYFATDPFALDMICHRELVAKRKAMGIQVNENPRFTEYLHNAEKYGLGIADVGKIKLVQI